MYEPPILGWLAFGWLLGLVLVLLVSTLYELRMWQGNRTAAAALSGRPGSDHAE